MRVSASGISESGAIDKWVAGASANSRYVFLSYISNPNLKSGQVATADFYVLTRSRQPRPLTDYEFTRKSTKISIGRLSPTMSSRTPFNVLQPVPLETLWAIPEVAFRVGQIFDDPVGPFPGAQRAGHGSVFLKAFRCGQGSIEAGSDEGLREVLTTIWCSDRKDVTLHSKFRVEN